MATVLPFTLKAAGESEMTAARYAWDDYRFHGVARIEGGELVLEWGGEVERGDMGMLSVSTTIDPVPTREVRIPAARLGAAALRGGWWRPRLEVTIADLDALAALPGSWRGRAVLRLTRRDLPVARAFVTELALLQAGAT